MFRMTLKQIQEIIDDQIEMYKDGKDRNILISISNTIYDYRNPEESEDMKFIQSLAEEEGITVVTYGGKKKKKKKK
jgi:hypothetical protein